MLAAIDVVPRGGASARHRPPRRGPPRPDHARTPRSPQPPARTASLILGGPDMAPPTPRLTSHSRLGPPCACETPPPIVPQTPPSPTDPQKTPIEPSHKPNTCISFWFRKKNGIAVM